jgi:FkbM family methyltransferase
LASYNAAMRRLINVLLGRLGRRFVSWPIPKGIVGDSHIAELLARHPVNVLIDVGAHRGETGLRFRRLGFQGRMASFEPHRSSFVALTEAACRDSNWRTFQAALGDESGTAVLHSANSTLLSSLHEASERGRVHFGDDLAAADETVRVERLDDAAASVFDGINDPIVYLKIDTQGHDLAVVRGARSTLRYVRVLQMEAAVRPIYEGAPTFAEVYDEAVAAGFALTAFVPGSRDKALAVNEMDAFFVRRTANP